MSILFEIKSLFKPVTTVQLAARELQEAKEGVAHARAVSEYAKRELLRAQSLLEYAEASTTYNKGRIERLEAMLQESIVVDCTNPLG